MRVLSFSDYCNLMWQLKKNYKQTNKKRMNPVREKDLVCYGKKKSIISIMSLDRNGEYINNQQRSSGFRDKSREKEIMRMGRNCDK